MADLKDLNRRIVAACATVTPETLANTWRELEYGLDICWTFETLEVPLPFATNGIFIIQSFGELSWATRQVT